MQKKILSAVVLVVCAMIAVSAKSKEAKLADIDPFPVSSLSFSTDSIIPDAIDLRECEEIVYARTDEMCLEYSVVPNKYRLFFGPAARSGIIDAAKKYLKEFEEHTLVKEKKTGIYGKVDARYEWGSLSYNAEARMKVSLGYRFIKDSPYFTIYLPVADNLLYKQNGSVIKQSGSSILFFTKAQLEAFGDTLDYDTIKSAVQEKVDENSAAKADEY